MLVDSNIKNIYLIQEATFVTWFTWICLVEVRHQPGKNSKDLISCWVLVYCCLNRNKHWSHWGWGIQWSAYLYLRGWVLPPKWIEAPFVVSNLCLWRSLGSKMRILIAGELWCISVFFGIFTFCSHSGTSFKCSGIYLAWWNLANPSAL